MRTATDWFDLYGESHRNATNKTIHWICIPLIVLATLGLIQAGGAALGDGMGLLTVGVVVAGSLAFYARLSWTIFAGMAGISAAMVGLNTALASAGLPLGWVSLGIFVAAWIAQFVGHKIEGKKPSFFQDLQFLLVGPAWLLQFVYRKVGIPVETHGRATAPT